MQINGQTSVYAQREIYVYCTMYTDNVLKRVRGPFIRHQRIGLTFQAVEEYDRPT